MPIAKAIRNDLERASWIRRMFEEGRRLKEKFGDRNVFDFSLGNPDIEPPSEFHAALRRLAESQETGLHAYMPNAGYPFVREAVAGKVSRQHACVIPPSHIVMTVGAAGGLNVVLKTILNPGDEVVVVRPYFAEYYFYIKNHGGCMIDVPCAPDFSLDPDSLGRALTPRTAAVIINSPNNPTGRVYPRADIEALADILCAHTGSCGRAPYLIVDEPYRDIVYDGLTVPPVLDAYAESCVVSSYSKSLSLPGERIGYIAVSDRLSDARLFMDGLAMANRTLGFVNAPALMQRVVAQLTECVADASSYRIRRDQLSAIVRAAGIEHAKPEGAFYLFCKVPDGGVVQASETRDVAFAMHLKNYNVLAVPGIGFGFPGWFRLSYCVSSDTIQGSAKGFAAAVADWRSGA